MANSVNGPVATRVLHCNFNTADEARANAFYTQGLGAKEKMRSASKGADSSALGLNQLTDSVAVFLYDHRGARVAPAVELVEWLSPTTYGEAYELPSEIGMAAAGFAVPSVAGSLASCIAAGGTDVGARLVGSAEIAVDAVVKDPDGVNVELIAGIDVPLGTFHSVRLNVLDLEAATAFYEAIGFRPLGGAESARWESEDPAWNGGVLVQRLIPGVSDNLEIHLTRWVDVEPSGSAHSRAHHRGIFRMALGVEDARAAVAASQPPVEPEEATFIPLPGTPLGGVWVAILHDLDGVMIEFVERPMDLSRGPSDTKA